MNNQFDGTYICTNLVIGLQGDTIHIQTTDKTIIKGFANVYNYTAGSCTIITEQNYEVKNNIIQVTNSSIYKNVLQLNDSVNVQDITISCCNNNQLNFKKIN